MCHVSVGHLARVFEGAGIPTVAVFVRAFRHIAEDMKVPRAIVTRHPMGRTLGAPGDTQRQRHVVRAALHVLEDARRGATLTELTEPYRPGKPTPHSAKQSERPS